MKTFLLLLLLSLPSLGWAADANSSSRGSNNGNSNSSGGGSGVSIGNGGQSVVCQEPERKFVRAEAFDLFEGRALFGFQNFYNEALPATELAKFLAKKVDQSQGGNREPLKTVEGKIDFIVKNLRFLPPGVGLKPTEDSKEFIVPKDCEIVQTINFRDSGQIFVDSDTWSKLPNSSKAALYLHEAIYWQFREQGLEQDSRRTRKAVAFLFSGGELAPRAQFVAPPTRPVQYCRSAQQNSSGDYNTKFFAYRHTNLEIIQFLQIGGYGLLGRTVITRVGQEGPDSFIQKNSKDYDQMAGWLNSQPDIETFLQLTWGRSIVKLLYRFQSDEPLTEDIVCEELDFSSRTPNK
jgi:hypothetical protein